MTCPRDNTPLTTHTKGHLDIHQCPTCHGFFVSLSQEQAESLHNVLNKYLSVPIPESQQESLQSPQSGQVMKQISYRNVIIDYCEDSHSLWFDPGEYNKIFSPKASSSSSPKQLLRNTPSKRETATDAVGDVLLSGIDPISVIGDITEFTGNSLGNLGDFVGDFVSGIDLF